MTSKTPQPTKHKLRRGVSAQRQGSAQARRQAIVFQASGMTRALRKSGGSRELSALIGGEKSPKGLYVLEQFISKNGMSSLPSPSASSFSASNNERSKVDSRDNADDVALDMDGGDTGFIFNSQLDMDTELDLAGFIADDADDMDYVDSY
ncbi:hypothetical protein B0H14DRAFT_2571801 [Mycena olivaceomarginata]|nr:hypothetical protein B0H14DRAFT_2612322 [Mycena olivaceomarginata]KAJ7869438.1 hypothetical protein B0H14DRAFT_2571801 [Mycena olivaceomarginata]